MHPFVSNYLLNETNSRKKQQRVAKKGRQNDDYCNEQNLSFSTFEGTFHLQKIGVYPSAIAPV